ncbi:hypothetical protein [Craterilacuibacter sp. RT1T]|nr:hypothetical protein [Craterilacuibacter sp. RT1T]
MGGILVSLKAVQANHIMGKARQMKKAASHGKNPVKAPNQTT